MKSPCAKLKRRQRKSERRRIPDLGLILTRLDFEDLIVTEGGERKRMPSIEVQYRKLFNDAIHKGDLGAAKLIVKMVQEFGFEEPDQEQQVKFAIVPDPQV